MTTATLTPIGQSATKKVGKRTYRKQILPKTSIHYAGRTLTFDDAYLTDLATSFQAGAYDQVPFVLADPNTNAHNMNPENFRGEVKGLEVLDDGLYAVVDFSEQGAALVDQNPNLGVSARIIEGLAKSDGRQFPRAIQHVLGTFDPKVTGLKSWETVDLSTEDTQIEVVDLTAATYEGTSSMTTPTQQTTTEPQTPAVPPEDQPLDLSGLSDDEFAALLAAVPDDENEVVPDETGELKQRVEVPASTTDLSVLQAQVNNDRAALQQMRKDAAQERWTVEREKHIAAGVPPFLVDLAAPVLSNPDTVVIDLATSATPVNATQIIRDMLEKSKGIVDLSEEKGHIVDLSDPANITADPVLAAWEAEYGKA